VRAKLSPSSTPSALQQALEPHLRGIARERSRDLRVDEPRRHAPGELEDHLEILACAVQHPGEARVEQVREQRLEIQAREAIDARDLLTRADLDQAELRIVGLLAHELRVDGGDLRRAERGHEACERGIVADPTDFLLCRHRPSSFLGRIRYHPAS
jgi:hypothetical protein